ncbi:DUF2200 domain-containing protein [Erythrobacter sp. SAORIC-644]|uniref:DUF2200 domain-containing protein n=1 Tax=Erythrobacter sp. SAORIC-644 TaxID=1869314 RepID=UPI001F1B1A0C|nr:DUF2200 family protein [Erythrobacter sp. SAORIC-644]
MRTCGTPGLPDGVRQGLSALRSQGGKVLKAEKKGRTREDVHTIIRWLTGYSEEGLAVVIADGTDMESFFARAPRLNPDRTLITGVICGIRVEEVEEETMREIRYLDKLIDELARGKAMDNILRKG